MRTSALLVYISLIAALLLVLFFLSARVLPLPQVPLALSKDNALVSLKFADTGQGGRRRLLTSNRIEFAVPGESSLTLPFPDSATVPKEFAFDFCAFLPSALGNATYLLLNMGDCSLIHTNKSGLAFSCAATTLFTAITLLPKLWYHVAASFGASVQFVVSTLNPDATVTTQISTGILSAPGGLSVCLPGDNDSCGTDYRRIDAAYSDLRIWGGLFDYTERDMAFRYIASG